MRRPVQTLSARRGEPEGASVADDSLPLALSEACAGHSDRGQATLIVLVLASGIWMVLRADYSLTTWMVATLVPLGILYLMIAEAF